MGTRWSLRIAGPNEAALPSLRQLIETTLDRVVEQMSGWDPGSALSRFNAARGPNWHALPSEFFTVLVAAYDLAGDTGGAFDPAGGVLADIWGFGPHPAPQLPPAADAVAEARAQSGWERLQLDRAARRAFQPGGLVLDLSGIAKGFAVDRVADALRQAGWRHFLIEVGGELRGVGVKPDGQPWWIEVETPPGATLPPMRVALHELAVATSGDYRRFFLHGGRRYAHSLDPRTGSPVDNSLASVTVLHPSCMMADALATALTVLGPTEGFAYAEERGVAALFVERAGLTFSERISPALADLLA